MLYFYPRPPRGGRLALALDGREILHISIHALREEGDGELSPCKPVRVISIHALREEGDAVTELDEHVVGGISIHALREEGDSKNRDKISIFL